MGEEKQESETVHFMIDIETLGTLPGSVILSIGAVAFDIETGDTFCEFYEVIDLESSLHAGFKVDSSTILWWMSEDQKEARIDLLLDMEMDSEDVHEVMLLLSEFIDSNTGIHEKIIWAKPPTFDLMILESAYDLLYIDLPWKHYEMRDLRTLEKIYEGPKPKFEIDGHKHNALYDAKLQAKICSHVWKWFNRSD